VQNLSGFEGSVDLCKAFASQNLYTDPQLLTAANLFLKGKRKFPTW